MSGGWLAGACYPTLVAADAGRSAFAPCSSRTPWQQTTIAVFAAYFGVASESFIIDIDHWRHTFLLLGVMWGLIAATRRYTARGQALADDDRLLFDGRQPGPCTPAEARRTRCPVGA